MSRMLRSAAVWFLTAVLCLGTSTGPGWADPLPGVQVHQIYLVSGPDQPGPDAVAPGGGVGRLALSSLLTLLIGAGLVLIARRGPNGPGSRRT